MTQLRLLQSASPPSFRREQPPSKADLRSPWHKSYLSVHVDESLDGKRPFSTTTMTTTCCLVWNRASSQRVRCSRGMEAVNGEAANRSDGNETTFVVSDEFVGGMEYVLQRPSLFLPYVTITWLTTLFGVLGNSLLIGAVLYSKELRNAGNMFVVNLAVAGFFAAAVTSGSTSVGALVGERYFLERPVLCQLIAATTSLVSGSVLLNLGVIAVNRYVKICHPQRYNTFFSHRKTIAICVAVWIVSAVLPLALVLRWGGYRYDRKALGCLPDRTAALSSNVFTMTVFGMMPGFVSATCYLRVFMFVRASKRRVNKAARATAETTATRATRSQQRLDISLTLTLFMVWVLYFLMVSPLTLIYILDHWDTLPPWMLMYTFALAYSKSAVDPVLYGVTNKTFRSGYIKLLHLHLCWKDLAAPSNRQNGRSTAMPSTYTHTWQVQDVTQF